MKKYRFECVDIDDETGMENVTVKEFDTLSDCWHGFDGPMYNFHDFLKGTGFVFDINAEIGVMEPNGEFRGAYNE